MRIQLIAFASAGEALGNRGGGSASLELELDSGARISDLRRRLAEHHPELEGLWPRLAVAVDGTLAHGDTELRDGCEVALLPPVSGGSSPSATEVPAALAEITDAPIDVADVERRVASADCGAVLLFLGTVRDHHQGRSVARLTYDAYRPMAREVLARIVRELEEAGDRLRAAIVHRVGDVPVGQASVVIAIASPHREAAYAASRTALERLKKEAPIWKREHYADGEIAWREEEPLVAVPASGP